MEQKNKAKAVYESFLITYPQHELSETVKLSIQYLDIPIENLVKQFEEKTSEVLFVTFLSVAQNLNRFPVLLF